MERRTALAASISMVMTVSVGALAFASLGGIDILGFGSNAQGATPEIVTTGDVAAGSESPIAAATTLAGNMSASAPAPTAVPIAIQPTGGAATSGTRGTPTAPGAATSTPAAPAAIDPDTGSTSATPTPAVTATPSAPGAAPTPAPTPTAPRATTPPTTAATTVPAAPSSTLPPNVEIPDDWPPNTPIPPIPPGCVDPHLEDDGVWNCQH